MPHLPLKSLLSALILLASLFATTSGESWGYARTKEACSSLLGGTQVTVIFSAVPTAPLMGIGEGSIISKALKNPRNLTIPGCWGATVGTLAGRKVAQIVTGEGHGTAQMCSFTVFSCASVISEAMYFGIAGFSPRVGGLLDPESGCEPTNQGDFVTPGDICVTHQAINWDCQAGPWSQIASAFPNVCSVPGDPQAPFEEVTRNPIEGGPLGWSCYLYPQPPAGSEKLSEMLISGGAKDLSTLSAPEPVRTWTTWWWGNQTIGANAIFSPSVASQPRIFGPKQCAELDSVYWWSGLPWEISARAMVASAVL